MFPAHFAIKEACPNFTENYPANLEVFRLLPQLLRKNGNFSNNFQRVRKILLLKSEEYIKQVIHSNCKDLGDYSLSSECVCRFREPGFSFYFFTAFFLISFRSLSGILRQEQLFWCSRCHFILCSIFGFFGILFFSCQPLFILTFTSPQAHQSRGA